MMIPRALLRGRVDQSYVKNQHIQAESPLQRLQYLEIEQLDPARHM